MDTIDIFKHNFLHIITLISSSIRNRCKMKRVNTWCIQSVSNGSQSGFLAIISFSNVIVIRAFSICQKQFIMSGNKMKTYIFVGDLWPKYGIRNQWNNFASWLYWTRWGIHKTKMKFILNNSLNLFQLKSDFWTRIIFREKMLWCYTYFLGT